MVKALVLTGYGINCDYETKLAFELAGAEAKRVHINDIIAGEEKISDYKIIAFPGGFSYGDDLGSGMVLANKIKNARVNGEGLENQIKKFIDDGNLIIGICNGLQALVKLGLLPAIGNKYFEQQASLTFNDSGKFEDRWVDLKVHENCIWTKNIEYISLPVRHGEGKFVASEDIIKKLFDKNLVACQYIDKENMPTMKYPDNPNGSYEAIAAICDETGRIFGLMPHPEAFLFIENHPQWTSIKDERNRQGKKTAKEGDGLQIFRNAVDCFK